jgi:4-amino-4-deoxy-L-arabinose transferase-like glycosyltransferase
MIRNNKVLILAIVLALAIRIVFFFALQPWDEEVIKTKILFKDGEYHRLALEIIHNGSFPSASRTPGYPVFLALLYMLFGVKIWGVALVQILLDVITVTLTYFLAMEMLDSKPAAKVAAFLYAASFLPAFYTSKIMTETLFTFLFILSILILIRSLKRGGVGGFAIAGILMGLAALVRPILQYYMVIVVFFTMCTGLPIRRKLQMSAAIILVFAAVVSVWGFRNYFMYDHFALTTIKGNNLSRDYAAFVKANLENIDVMEARKQLDGNSLEGVTNPFEESKIRQKNAMKYISEHPLPYLKYHLKGSLSMFIGTSKGAIMQLFGLRPASQPDLHLSESFTDKLARTLKNSRDEYFLTPILGAKLFLEYAFCAIGLLMMLYKNKKLYVLLVLVTIIYYAGLTGVLGNPRYRVPIVPLYLVVSAYGIYGVFGYIKRRVRPTGAT